MLNTIVRTGQVLELFSRERPEWGVTEIAQTLGVPKSNAHELLSSLASIDLLRRTSRSRYRLGWRIMSMANSVVEAGILRKHALSAMEKLSQHTGETSHLAIWDGRHLVFMARVLTDRGVHQGHARAGCTLPGYCTASGKVLLADLPWPEVVDRVSREEFNARTPSTITDLVVLRRQLQDVKNRGVGYNVEEADPGVCGLASPVVGADGRAIAALGVSVTSERFTDFRERYERLLVRSARELSAKVAADHGPGQGGPGPGPRRPLPPALSASA
ncbi:IclR family transcriptional regulator [Streptomyces hirsutus]|uniref:IclR family transcriptional regulator n=1 Tax=Streptomyces hirsutus TaxID=35620 RepID=UPI0036CBBAA0